MYRIATKMTTKIEFSKGELSISVEAKDAGTALDLFKEVFARVLSIKEEADSGASAGKVFEKSTGKVSHTKLGKKHKYNIEDYIADFIVENKIDEFTKSNLCDMMGKEGTYKTSSLVRAFPVAYEKRLEKLGFRQTGKKRGKIGSPAIVWSRKMSPEAVMVKGETLEPVAEPTVEPVVEPMEEPVVEQEEKDTAELRGAYLCPECTDRFHTADWLIKHMKEAHGKIISFEEAEGYKED